MRTSMTRVEVPPERVGLPVEVDLLLGDLRAALVEVLALAVASDEWDRGHLRALVGRIDEMRGARFAPPAAGAKRLGEASAPVATHTRGEDDV